MIFNSQDPEMEARIKALHEAYITATDMAVQLDFSRRMAWEHWLAYRREEMFTVDDLRLAVHFVRKQIREGKNNLGALRFRNLIERPDLFEEILAMAQSARTAAARLKPVDANRASVLRQTGRDPAAPAPALDGGKIDMGKVIDALRSAAK